MYLDVHHHRKASNLRGRCRKRKRGCVFRERAQIGHHPALLNLAYSDSSGLIASYLSDLESARQMTAHSKEQHGTRHH